MRLPLEIDCSGCGKRLVTLANVPGKGVVLSSGDFQLIVPPPSATSTAVECNACGATTVHEGDNLVALFDVPKH